MSNYRPDWSIELVFIVMNHTLWLFGHWFLAGQQPSPHAVANTTWYPEPSRWHGLTLTQSEKREILKKKQTSSEWLVQFFSFLLLQPHPGLCTSFFLTRQVHYNELYIISTPHVARPCDVTVPLCFILWFVSLALHLCRNDTPLASHLLVIILTKKSERGRLPLKTGITLWQNSAACTENESIKV